MADGQSPAVLVARFLKANHYNKTLEAFLREANLTEKAAITNSGDWTLEKLLDEKIQFDSSLNFERKDSEAVTGWTRPAPSSPSETNLPVTTNVLSVNASPGGMSLAITTADNSCSFIASGRPYENLADKQLKADSPILSTNFLTSRHAAVTTMSGKISIYDCLNGCLVSERRDHSKWAVGLASWQAPNAPNVCLVASAGWDAKVHLYSCSGLGSDQSTAFELQQPVHTITLQSNPESLLFVTNPDTRQLYLIISRRDSSFLYYFRIDLDHSHHRAAEAKEVVNVTPAGRQNLAPHSNAWVAFTPSALALHPSDPTLLAIATSHLPHLKVIIVRLLFPDIPSTQGFAQQAVPQTAASAARADLALQDREDAAITLQVSTQAPQTPYSTPQIAWRPDGSGVWVNGDDGVVRGVEVKTGKVVALLQAHEAGSKVRTLWAGYLSNGDGHAEGKREVVVSGGFDKKVFVWEIPQQGSAP